MTRRPFTTFQIGMLAPCAHHGCACTLTVAAHTHSPWLRTHTHRGCACALTVAARARSPWLRGCAHTLTVAAHTHSPWLRARTHRGCVCALTVAARAHSPWLCARAHRGCARTLTVAARAHSPWLCVCAHRGCARALTVAARAHRGCARTLTMAACARAHRGCRLAADEMGDDPEAVEDGMLDARLEADEEVVAAAAAAQCESESEDEPDEATIERPPHNSKKTLFEKATEWPTGSSIFVAVSMSAEAQTAAPGQIVSLAARVADPYGVLNARQAAIAPFHEDIARGDAQAFAATGERWVCWLKKLTAPGRRVVLTMWDGLSKGSPMFELLGYALRRHKVTLPNEANWDALDLSSNKALLGTVGTQRILSGLAANVLEEGIEALGKTRTGTAAGEELVRLGELDEASASVPVKATMISAIVHAIAEAKSKAGRSKAILSMAPFLEFGDQTVAHEEQSGRVPKCWSEDAAPWAPEDCRHGPTFESKAGELPMGGPSQRLMAAVGYADIHKARTASMKPFVVDADGTPNEAVRNLMLNIFDFFIDRKARELIVDATNDKAAELVVKEHDRGGFRMATAADPVDQLFNVKGGPHARHRAPDLVKNPLTSAELEVFIGIRILMGANWKERVDYYWSAKYELKLIANAMRSDRFKLILAQLSFMKSADVLDPSKWPDDKLRKIREFINCVKGNCQMAWDIEPDFVPDESRLRMSSRYCPFTTYLSCKPIKNGLTVYCLNFCRTKFLYNFEFFTGALVATHILCGYKLHCVACTRSPWLHALTVAAPLHTLTVAARAHRGCTRSPWLHALTVAARARPWLHALDRGCTRSTVAAHTRPWLHTLDRGCTHSTVAAHTHCGCQSRHR